MGGAVSADYQQVKLWLIDVAGLSKDALHIYAGLAIFLGILLIWRGRRAVVVAWLAALLAALAGEWLDIQGEALRGDLQPDAAHWHDIWNTMFWPSLLALTLRWLPQRAGAASSSSDESAERSLEQT